MKRVFGLVFIMVGILFFFHIIMDSDIINWLTHRTTIEKVIPSININEIRVEATNEDVQIIPYDQDGLKVVLTGENISNVNLNADRDLRSAWITLDPKWYAISASPHQLRLIVYIPKQLFTSMKVLTTNGNIQIGSQKGAVWKLDHLTTEVNAGETVLVNTKLQTWHHNGVSGNMKVNKVNINKAELGMISGDVDFKHFKGAVDLTLTSGNARMQMDQLLGDIKTEIVSGNLSLLLPQLSSFRLKTNVESGEINTSFPLVLHKHSTDETIATHGAGHYQIQAELTSGSLMIYE